VLHFISGTSSFTDFSLRQVMKLSSRKLHSALRIGQGVLLSHWRRVQQVHAII
jgi:hypothetical protein